MDGRANLDDNKSHRSLRSRVSQGQSSFRAQRKSVSGAKSLVSRPGTSKETQGQQASTL